MSKTVWIEETTDPTTGEDLVFTADSELELDAKIRQYFGDVDDEPSQSDGPGSKAPHGAESDHGKL